MSASPADRTPGRTPNGVNPPPPRRPRPPVDPLVKPKRKPIRPGQNGPGVASKTGPNKDRPRHLQVSELPKAVVASFDAHSDPNFVPSGFSSAPVSDQVHDYPLVISKRALAEGLRHHIAKFSAKRSMDPRDENDFTRPVRLQRRDARAPAPGTVPAEGEANAIDPEERERRELEKAERNAKREIELAQIAPAATTASKRTNTSKQKTEKVYRHDQTDDKKAASQLRYEEALQWHLEDFDNKQSWVGNYEAALSGTHAQMVLKDGKFRLVPLEKWYKFTPKLHIKPMPLEDAEQKLSQKAKDPEWFVERQQQDKRRQMEEDFNRRATSRLYVGGPAKGAAGVGGVAVKAEIGDVDELDFEEDRFADDEENELFEGDLDEVKANEERIKKDQLQANIFDLKDEKEYERAEQQEQRAKLAEKQHGKRVKKALMKREKNRIYDSDSEHPYSEDTDDTESEGEKAKQDEAKKEEDKDKDKAKGGSGNSSKNNTPSNRASKHPERASLKRSGSANPSDLSGNESSRKKQKQQHSRLGTGANTPNGTASRSGSPGIASSQDVQKKPSASRGADGLKRSRGGAGSGSDGEGLASGAEMSDGTRKKVKVLVKKTNSSNVSPGGSRSGSPDRDGARSRALSPDAQAVPIPTTAQIKAAIPAEGITLVDLMNKLGKASFQGGRKGELFAIIKKVSTFDKTTKMLRPLTDKGGRPA